MSAHNIPKQLHDANVFVPVGALTTHPTILYGAGAPTDGTSGTGVGDLIGSLYIDITNGVLYINTNTAASPTWTKVGTQS